LAVAVPTGLGLIALLVASVWFTPWVFVGLVCVALALALRELTDALARAGFAVPYVPLAVGAAATQVAAALAGPAGVLVGVFLTLAAGIAWRALDFDYRQPSPDAVHSPPLPAPGSESVAAAAQPPADLAGAPPPGPVPSLPPDAVPSLPPGPVSAPPPGPAPGPASRSLARDVCATAFAIAYLPTLAALVVLLSFMPQGRWLVLLLVAIPVASDTGGFFAGSYFGKHKMAPNVSPKKTWEGMAGSVALATVAGVGGMILMDRPWYFGLALALLGSFSATLGDLAESMLKRSIGIKDMGSLLPGHGGVLDRVDSILMTAPFAYTVLALLGGGVFG
jgi:phosphatidate cytidylyltransferase